ncbi:MAG: galactokinase [Bacteroidota bacterium]
MRFDRLSAIVQEQRGHFLTERAKVTVARAPARMDVMGGIADYSGSLVLEGTLSEAAYAAVQPRRDSKLRAMTVKVKDVQQVVEFSLDDLFDAGRLKSYSQLGKLFDAEAKWAGYVLGGLLALQKEKVVSGWSSGLNVMLCSDIPIGAGVASSAAIEVAAMKAIAAAFGIELEGLQLAKLCQIVENRIVGAPCGIMDQVTSALGQRGKLLALCCQPCEITGFHETPAGFRFVAINSGVKHSVGGTAYGRVRAGAFMGYKIMQTHCGGDYGGYWCNVTPEQFEAEHECLLPEEMTGSDFIERYEKTDDTVTTVKPEMTYPVRQASRHPVYENARVRRFIDLLEKGDEPAVTEAGKLMYAAHESYSACGLGCAETDLLVSLAKKLGPKRGFYGAKITGGGSGGTVAILVRAGTDDLVKQIAAEYREKTGIVAKVLTGSSEGAVAWGIREL